MSIISSRKAPSPTYLRDDGSSRRQVEASLLLNRWPLRDEPQTAAIALGVIALLILLVALETASIGHAALALIVLALADWRNLLPVSYLLDASGIEQRVLFLRRRIAWAAVARCEVWPNGVRLMRSAAGHPLDALRSIFIPWQTDRDAILALLVRRALRARLVDGEGHVLPSTVSHPAPLPSSIPAANPLTLATPNPPSTATINSPHAAK
jgi:hypothetical protein